MASVSRQRQLYNFFLGLLLCLQDGFLTSTYFTHQLKRIQLFLLQEWFKCTEQKPTQKIHKNMCGNVYVPFHVIGM